jgi:hypothetical protein
MRTQFCPAAVSRESLAHSRLPTPDNCRTPELLPCYMPCEKESVRGLTCGCWLHHNFLLHTAPIIVHVRDRILIRFTTMVTIDQLLDYGATPAFMPSLTVGGAHLLFWLDCYWTGCKWSFSFRFLRHHLTYALLGYTITFFLADPTITVPNGDTVASSKNQRLSHELPLYQVGAGLQYLTRHSSVSVISLKGKISGKISVYKLP